MTFQGAPSLAKSEDDMKRADDKPSSDVQPIALKIICPPPEVRHITPRIVRGTPPSCPWSDLMKGNKKQNERSE